VLDVSRTPNDTFGRQRTQIGNISLILKGLLYTCDRIAVSGGASLQIPTAPDTEVRVTDYLGDLLLNNAEAQRVREFHIKNETWAISPFLAFLATPNDRWFVQSFLQFELPLNKSEIIFRETLPQQRPGLVIGPDNTALGAPDQIFPPFEDRQEIGEQALMHFDIGTGFWLMQNPDARWITGIAPTVELHYTTTLENAEIVSLQRDFAFQVARLPGGGLDPNIANATAAPPPQVGNRRNRVDILDVTLGTTFVLGSRATLGTAVSLPLRDDDDRTYDWEAQVQFNYYFGRSAQRLIPPQY
jgi:hypothetical protein